MKNKIVSVLLTVAMLLSVCAVALTGCSQEKSAEEIEQELLDEQANAASTLVMWVVTEEGTDPEQAADVQKAMAEITKSKYKTDLVIRYLTMDEYYEKLEAAIAETERLASLKTLAAAVAKVTKKASNDVTGAYKNGEVAEADRDELFFTYFIDAIKEINSVVTGTSTNEDYLGTTVSDEELEEMLIEVVGQLVEYEMADAFLEDRDALIATMRSELENPPAATDVKKNYIYMTQSTIDIMEQLFDLIEEHKDSFIEAEEDEEEEEEEEEDEDQIIRDEEGNMIVDTTVYPEVEDHQVDIIYISGYDKYTEYIENEWIVALDSELSGSSKAISSYVSTSLLNAVKVDGSTYAIPNNNVIGEYTYMLIDKELFDKYYYTGTVENVHSIVDVASFIEDIATYEPDVLPINGDVDYCMSLIAHYWSIDPATLAINPGTFSILGHAYAPDELVTRGSTAMTFTNLLADDGYVESLMNLKEYEFAGYFGTPAEGQKSAISFVSGDASVVEDYEDDNYVVVVDYPKAADEDIYANMFAISAYTSNLSRSMQVITLLNTDAEFRNLFQYGIEGVNYTLNEDGSAKMTANNAYNMDIAKTGNEFIAYVPEGTNVEVWEYAKQQNRESQVDPLLGFSFANELTSEEEDAMAEDADEIFYYVETLDTELIKYISDTSAKVWAEIQACEDIDALDDTISTWSKTLSKDAKIKSAMVYEIIEPKLDEATGEVAAPSEDEDESSSSGTQAKDPTVTTSIAKTMKRTVLITSEVTQEVIETEETYFLINKTYNPYQIYYRWMSTYGYVPAGFGTVTIQ